MSSNTAIQLKKSGETGNTPSDLNHGEVAINYADGKLYYKNSIDDISFINNQDSFVTINVDSELVLATSPTDTLTLVSGNNVSLSANASSKTITISAIVQQGFPIIDLGYVSDGVVTGDTLDFGTLA
jgi:hypothetical protein